MNHDKNLALLNQLKEYAPTVGLTCVEDQKIFRNINCNNSYYCFCYSLTPIENNYKYILKQYYFLGIDVSYGRYHLVTKNAWDKRLDIKTDCIEKLKPIIEKEIKQAKEYKVKLKLKSIAEDFDDRPETTICD